MRNVVLNFGFQKDGLMTQLEFENFLENMFCGVMNVVTPPEMVLN